MHLIFAYTFTSQLHILLCIPSFYCEGLAHISECLFVRLVLYPLLLIFCFTDGLQIVLVSLAYILLCVWCFSLGGAVDASKVYK